MLLVVTMVILLDVLLVREAAQAVVGRCGSSCGGGGWRLAVAMGNLQKQRR